MTSRPARADTSLMRRCLPLVLPPFERRLALTCRTRDCDEEIQNISTVTLSQAPFRSCIAARVLFDYIADARTTYHPRTRKFKSLLRASRTSDLKKKEKQHRSFRHRFNSEWCSPEPVAGEGRNVPDFTGEARTQITAYTTGANVTLLLAANPSAQNVQPLRPEPLRFELVRDTIREQVSPRGMNTAGTWSSSICRSSLDRRERRHSLWGFGRLENADSSASQAAPTPWENSRSPGPLPPQPHSG
jgi:hypothetical protein